MLTRGQWVVNKVVGVGWCDVPECMVAPPVYGGGYMPSLYTEILCLTKAREAVI